MSFFDRLASFFRGAPQGGTGAGDDPAGAIIPIDRPIREAGPDADTDPAGAVVPLDRPIGGPAETIGPIEAPAGGAFAGIVAPSDMPTGSGDGDPAGSFFDAPTGDDDALPHGDTDAVSFGPKHEDPSMPAPEGAESSVVGPGEGEGPDWGGTDAVSFGPKHEDPSMPVPDASQSIGPKPEDPLANDVGALSTVGGPGGGGPGDVGALSTVGEPGSGGGPGDVGALAGGANQADESGLMDDGPSTLLGDDGASGFDTEMMPADLTDVAAGADFDAGGMLEP